MPLNKVKKLNTIYLVLTLCYPTDDKYERIIENMVDLKGSDKFFSDLKVTWPAIAGSSIIALIIS